MVPRSIACVVPEFRHDDVGFLAVLVRVFVALVGDFSASDAPPDAQPPVCATLESTSRPSRTRPRASRPTGFLRLPAPAPTAAVPPSLPVANTRADHRFSSPFRSSFRLRPAERVAEPAPAPQLDKQPAAGEAGVARAGRNSVCPPPRSAAATPLRRCWGGWGWERATALHCDVRGAEVPGRFASRPARHRLEGARGARHSTRQRATTTTTTTT